MAGYVDPRELTPGYSHSQGKGVAAYWGVLRDGSREVWRCARIPRHRPHMAPVIAVHCAEAELERRLQGAKSVLGALHCAPCWAFWDLGATAQGGLPEAEASALMRGLCPRCAGRTARVRIAVLEREEASVR
jgi:hypothetical protein